jgi:hypothetical protein
MYDFHLLAQRAMVEYRYQPGLIGIELAGEPAEGLRFIFEDEETASRFHSLRTIQQSNGNEGKDLRITGSDVMELWRG